MNLYIKWKTAEMAEALSHTFCDINPAKTNISYGYLYFEANENQDKNHWQFRLDTIIEMNMAE